MVKTMIEKTWYILTSREIYRNPNPNPNLFFVLFKNVAFALRAKTAGIARRIQPCEIELHPSLSVLRTDITIFLISPFEP